MDNTSTQDDFTNTVNLRRITIPCTKAIRSPHVYATACALQNRIISVAWRFTSCLSIPTTRSFPKNDRARTRRKSNRFCVISHTVISFRPRSRAQRVTSSETGIIKTTEKKQQQQQQNGHNASQASGRSPAEQQRGYIS